MKRNRTPAWLGPLILSVVCMWICREAFYTESAGHWQAMHSEWMSLAHQQGLDWFAPRWWKFWGVGAPLENTYAPLIPFSIAAISRLFGVSDARAFHIITGVVFCLGPVLLCVACRHLTRSTGLGLAAGSACLLLAPSQWIVPDKVWRWTGPIEPRRLFLIFDWDEVPHLTSLALLPLLVILLRRAARSRRVPDCAAVVACMVAIMLANMFGTVLVAITVGTAALAFEGAWIGLPLAGVSYLIVCPWIPPSLFPLVRANGLLHGDAQSWPRTLAALGIIALAEVGVWFATKRMRSPEFRWALLFACPMLLIPILGTYAKLAALQQPSRYKWELEVGLILAAALGIRAAGRRIPIIASVALVALGLALAISHRSYATTLMRTVDLPASIEYRTAKWVEEHPPGQRVMMSGTPGQWLNLWTDVEQFSAQPYTTAPNTAQQIALFTIYRDENTGTKAAELSILWLKAFGVSAIAVPGTRSPEWWKPFLLPRKFEDVLPALWREDDTPIYEVPLRSPSLAHVVPTDSLVRRRPVHGLDVAETQIYVNALDHEPQPFAAFEWQGSERALIRARVAAGQVVSVQVHHDQGWRASRGRISADGLGLIVVEPDCIGDCEISLVYDGGFERKTLRAISAFTALAGLVVLGGSGILRVLVKARKVD